ncbi:MAG: type IX secretion system sortase PorU [Crocinitomicaceae bacterium]
MPLRGEYTHEYRLTNIQYTDIELPSYYDKKSLPTTPNLKVDFGQARIDNFVRIYYYPIVLINGQVKLVENIEIETSSEKIIKSQDRGATFAANSVLASGSWYKIGVSQTGVHKLDQQFFSDLGISTSGLSTNSINIYGNHTPKLPLSNNAYHPDDLLKNAIYIQGDSDNSFDANDYVLFYATGPDLIGYNTTDIDSRKNNIDSLNYYYIHIDGTDAPKRIGNINDSPLPSTHNLTSFNEVVYHENNDINLIKSGTVWLGEFFDIELTKSISMSLPDIDINEDVRLKTAYASYMKSGSASLEVIVNGIVRDDIASTNTTGSYTEAKKFTSQVDFPVTGSTLNFTINWNRTSPATTAWLDYLMVNYKRKLTLASSQLVIKDLTSIGVGNVAQYSVSSANSNSFFWEVTDPANAANVNGVLSGSTYTFKQNADSLRTFVAFNANQAHENAIGIGSIENQNLHASPQTDYLIITHATLQPQAERLANLHRAKGLDVQVVEIQKVYNEFSGGVADPVAVRWMAKMFYDRAAGDPNLMPKYLCLFGDGTYDPLNRLENNNYLIPTFNNDDNDNDIDYVDSYTSDDFFGILDDSESMASSDMMDIAVGRIPVTLIDEASGVIDKVEHYMNFGSFLYGEAAGIQCDESGYSTSFGDWRNKLVLMADDENNGQFVYDCEVMSDTTENLYPEMNIVKIYLDAYQQVVTSGGQRYPDVEEAINQNMNNGALVFNYVGHGGETGLTLERALTYAMIENWNNVNNMTVFISATCEFSRFDDPSRVSAGERTLTVPFGGAVGLLTTTRLVYISLNSELVRNLYTVLFAEENGEALALGEIIRRTKNLTSSTENKRNFTLIGDPALKLGKPKPLIVTDSINSVAVTMGTDTLKALSKITVSGHVGDAGGAILSTYNGIVYPTVYDKWKVKNTLGQDPASPVRPFDVQNNIIYKGKSTVTNGRFEFSFVVPKDIDYAFGKGKISYYSNDAVSNSYGYDTTIVVGGVDPNGIVDEVGPVVDLYMNDPNFVNGGITDESPLFLAEISDENGINTTGNGIGHDITIILDGNTADPIILNNFYEADLDTYQSGKVSYKFSDLEVGPHSLVFKVWDVNNNSSETTLEFTVVEDEELGISHLLNYPNPFTTNTDFYFEHNQVCNSLDVKIEIFTVSGKLVKSIIENVNTSAFRSEGINWDGRDDYGDKLGRGVYVYRLSIETPSGKKAEKLEKLVIL